MNLNELKYCPGTLAKGFSTYSPGCLRNLFNNKKVNHFLSYEPPQQSEEVAENSALDELKAQTKKSNRSILDQITFENYSYYLGFDKL